MSWKNVLAGLKSMPLERTQRAFALLPLATFVLLYCTFAMLLDEMWRPAFLGLAACYLIAFIALGSDWFWARWYTMGLAWSGVMVGVYAIVTMGAAAPLVIYAALHGAIVLLLRGGKLVALYEGQTAWRERYGLDEHGAARVGKAVSRTSASLPSLVLWALAPKPPENEALFAFAGSAFMTVTVWLTLLMAVGALFAFVRGRAVGACFLIAAAASVVFARLTMGAQVASSPVALQALVLGATTVAPLALCGAVLPIAGPVFRYLRGR
ncbi:MAG: hypothetical protein SF187_10145 [Deltaproteobacteria bacterium]|nr:hypothetical protein [Deltaproteobacteria bacterium]